MAWGALIGLGLGAYSAWKGNKSEKKSDDYNSRALDMAQRQYNERAPLRESGMRALGRIEAPMDMGNHMYDSGNPYAAARGRTGSTADIGNWGQNTFDLDQVRANDTQNNEIAEYDRGDKYLNTVNNIGGTNVRMPVRRPDPLPWSGYGPKPDGPAPTSPPATIPAPTGGANLTPLTRADDFMRARRGAR